MNTQMQVQIIFYKPFWRKGIRVWRIYLINLIGVSLLLAMTDAGNTCKAVIMEQKKVQLVWGVNLKKCLHCPNAVCVAGTVCIR